MKFGTAIVDPPWSYGRTKTRGGVRADGSEYTLHGYSSEHYEPMSHTDLVELSIGDLVDGLLLLWTTGPFIPDALGLVSAWGFEYVTTAYWHKASRAPEGHLLGDPVHGFAFPHKPAYGVGYWLRGDTEPILIAKKKGSRSYRTKERATFVTRTGDHSAKPDVLHEWVERYIQPTQQMPLLEVFARRSRPGWTCVGGEAPGYEGQDIRTSLAGLLDA